MILTKLVCMQKIWAKPSMNLWWKSAKMQEQNISMTQMHLFSAQTLWMMFMKILTTTIQAEKKKKKINYLWWHDCMLSAQTLWMMFIRILMTTFSNRKKRTLIVFDNIMTKEKFQAIVQELFIKCRKLNILVVFITQFYFLFQKMSD